MTYERDPGLDVRRPDLKGVRRTGTVRWWKEAQGYGRITADDGEILFAHFTGMEGSGYRSLEPGQGCHSSGMEASRTVADIGSKIVSSEFMPG